MTERRSLSPTKRVRVFQSAGGRCHICEGLIRVGEPWEVEHVIPLALGGDDAEANMRPAHRDCHRTKTRADNASWTKAKRIQAKHIGAKKANGFRKPPPGYAYSWALGRVVKQERQT